MAERQDYICEFRLFCRHPETGDLYEKKLEVHQDVPLMAATMQAHELLGLSDLVPLERCRLVKFDDYSENLDESFDDSVDVTIGEVVGGAKREYSFQLFMEVRDKGEVFQVYENKGSNLKLLIVSLPTGEIEGPVAIRAEQGWTVQRLKETIARKLSLPVDTMVVALQNYAELVKPLNDLDATLKKEGVYRRHTMFVCCDAEDCQREFEGSKMMEVIDYHTNSILLHITLQPPQLADIGFSFDPESHDQPLESHDQSHGKDFSATFELIEESVNVGEDGLPEQRMLDIHIDRRSTLEQLKKKLEKYVKLPSSKFKVYRVYSYNNEESEMTHLNDSLNSLVSETRLVVRPE